MPMKKKYVRLVFELLKVDHSDKENRNCTIVDNKFNIIAKRNF